MAVVFVFGPARRGRVSHMMPDVGWEEGGRGGYGVPFYFGDANYGGGASPRTPSRFPQLQGCGGEGGTTTALSSSALRPIHCPPSRILPPPRQLESVLLNRVAFLLLYAPMGQQGGRPPAPPSPPPSACHPKLQAPQRTDIKQGGRGAAGSARRAKRLSGAGRDCPASATGQLASRPPPSLPPPSPRRGHPTTTEQRQEHPGRRRSVVAPRRQPQQARSVDNSRGSTLRPPAAGSARRPARATLAPPPPHHHPLSSVRRCRNPPAPPQWARSRRRRRPRPP